MKTLTELKKSQNNILILHYACTDITKSPVIISSISIKDFSARQALSFSFDEYGNEKNLLSEFIKQIKKYQNHLIVTWNQKDSTYGIQQIQRRCKDLGITENFPIDLEQISDLDDLFTEKYGRNYVDNPRLRCLAEVNGITLNHFVDGIDELRLFEEKEYKKIENSTNRKVNIIADYLSSAFDDRLKISKQLEVDDVIEPFKLPALEQISKIVGEYFTGFEITGLFKKSGHSEIVHDGSTKWRFLYSTFENILKTKFGQDFILKFLETACDPQEYFEKPESHITILHKLNDVLSFYGMKINEKGKVIKIKEKRDTISMTTKNDPDSSSSKTFDLKKIEEEVKKAKEGAIPRMVVIPSSGESFAPGRKPGTKPTQPKQKPPLSKSQKIELSGILGIAAIIVAVLLSPIGMDWIFPPEPEINVTDLNAQDGIVEGNKFVYSYEPRSLTPNGTKNEIFYLKVSNTGNADAHDFWIIMDSKPDGLWFDFRSSAIIHEGNAIPCQQKSSYCTIGLVPKESSNLVVEYNVEFDHKLYQEIVDETPKLFFNYGFDEGEEQTIEVLLKFD